MALKECGYFPASFTPEPSRQILDVLPGDAAGAGAAGDRPFVRLGAQLVFGERRGRKARHSRSTMAR